MFFRVTPVTSVGSALKLRKLTPCFVGPYQISKKIGEMSYQINLSFSLATLYDVFHVPQLMRNVLDPSHVI